MTAFLIIITIIISILLSIIVLIQNPKGGGLDASFGGVSNNTFGAARTTDFLEKATWGLAAALVVISISSSLFYRTTDTSNVDDIINAQPIQEQPAPTPQEGSDIAPINE